MCLQVEMMLTAQRMTQASPAEMSKMSFYRGYLQSSGQSGGKGSDREKWASERRKSRKAALGLAYLKTFTGFWHVGAGSICLVPGPEVIKEGR
jgi:hypothetical protein